MPEKPFEKGICYRVCLHLPTVARRGEGQKMEKVEGDAPSKDSFPLRPRAGEGG